VHNNLIEDLKKVINDDREEERRKNREKREN
jgi:hypothetical protein